MRHAKQFIYGIFYLALWAGLIGGIYAWQKPAPSCFDGTQNQGEAGVDCGGPCARVCIPADIGALQVIGTPQMILLGGEAPSSTVFAMAPSSTAVHASVVAEIKNANLDFGASSFGYTFTVYDRGGAAIASFPGNSFIYPGEIKYLILPNAALPAGASPASAGITLQDPAWTPAARFPRPQLSIQAANTAVTNSNLETQGTLVNQDSIDFSAVYLTALYYDASGTIAGVSATELDNVAAGDSRDFALFHPVITAALDRTQVFATAFNPR